MASNPHANSPTGGIPRGRRSRPRARIALPAILETMEGLRKVKLSNLSSAGAMVEARKAPDVGRDLVLKCPGIDALGVVVWENGDRCGIEFYDPIEDDEVVRQRELSDGRIVEQRWYTRDELIEAAERWSSGKS